MNNRMTITHTNESDKDRAAITAMKRGSGRGIRRPAGLSWLLSPLPEARGTKAS